MPLRATGLQRRASMDVDGFQRRGQAWFCTTGLPSDITVEVGEMLFHLHKFPLISRSGRIARLVIETTDDDDESCSIQLSDVPGGADAFELAAKFCYGVKVELTAANVAALRCAAEYLEMTDDYGEENLISKAEMFINQAVICSWKDSVKTLQSCEALLPLAEDLQIVQMCVDSLAMKACTDPSLFGWPMTEHGPFQSPGGSLLWNGINTGARVRNPRLDWWHEDITVLSLPLYRRVITAMESKGLRSESIAGALMHYARKSVPGLNRRQGGRDSGLRVLVSSLSTAPSENEQRALLESIEDLLPSQKGVATTQFLLASLRTAMILNSSRNCRNNLERRIGAQLEQAALDDLLIPNYSYTSETLYDVDCIQRILDHFLVFDETHEADTPRSFDGSLIGSPSPSPIVAVAKLLDGYLAEVAPDVNLKPAKFQSLAEALPEYARGTDDGLYRSIDIYLKAHPWLTEPERDMVSSIMDCQKLSLEACTHAAQNDRLPLRIVVQVLFFEQLQLRSAISGSFFTADSTDLVHHSRPNLTGASISSVVGGDVWARHVREGQVQRSDLDNMRLRVTQIESECSSLKIELQKLRTARGFAGSWNAISRKFGCKNTFEVCDSHEKGVIGGLDSNDEKEHNSHFSKRRRNFRRRAFF